MEQGQAGWAGVRTRLAWRTRAFAETNVQPSRQVLARSQERFCKPTDTEAPLSREVT